MPGACPLLLGCSSPFLSASARYVVSCSVGVTLTARLSGARFSGAGSCRTRWRLQDDGLGARAGAVSSEAAGDKGGVPGRGGGARRCSGAAWDRRRSSGLLLWRFGQRGRGQRGGRVEGEGGWVRNGRLAGDGSYGASLVLPPTCGSTQTRTSYKVKAILIFRVTNTPQVLV